MYTSKMMYLIEALRDERITPDQYNESMRRIQHEMDKDSRSDMALHGRSSVSSDVLCCEDSVNQQDVSQNAHMRGLTDKDGSQ